MAWIRISKLRGLALALATLAALGAALVGRAEPPAKGKKPAEKAATKSALKPEQLATPEKTFATAHKLLAAGKYKAFIGCLSEDGLNEFAGSLRMVTGMMVAFPPPADEPLLVEAQVSVKQLIEKYKPPENSEPPVTIDLSKSDAEASASMHAAVIAEGKAIPNRAGFVADALKLLVELAAAKTGKSPISGMKLADLKIDGDVAKGMITGWMDGKPENIAFRRIDDQWKIQSIGKFEVTTNVTIGEAMPETPAGGKVTLTPSDLPTTKPTAPAPAVPAPTVPAEDPGATKPPRTARKSPPPGTTPPLATTPPLETTPPFATTPPLPTTPPLATTPPLGKKRRAAQSPAESKPVESTPVTPAKPSGPVPRLVVEAPKFDFGEAESGTDVAHTFVLENAGDAPLEITKFSQSGGVSYTPAGRRTIAPGERLEIEATLSLKAQRTRLSREIVVHSNDPVAPQFHLVFSGVAVPRAKIDPPRADVGQVTGSASASKTFKVTGERGLSFNITGTKTSSEAVSVEVKTVTPGSEYEVTATVTGPLPAGAFKGWVRLITDQPGEYHTIGIPVVAEAK